MPTTLAIRLPFGKLHATPWDRNVNEAAVEWPPSPWRLLRALYAVWRDRAPDLDADVVTGLLADLAVPPVFLLPEAREASTRHFMPSGQHLPGVKTDTDKVLDAFVVTERDAELRVRWDVDLAPERRAALDRLARALPYLGRAESVCEAALLDEVEDDQVAGDGSADDGQVVLPASLASATWLVPVPDAAPDAGDDAARAAADGGADDGRRPSVVTRVLCPRRPLDVDALVVTTTAMRAARRLLPDGAVWQRYRSMAAPAAAPASTDGARTGTRSPPTSGWSTGRSSPSPAPRATRRRVTPTAVRWALNGPALPSVTMTVPLTDALRRACMSRYGGEDGGGSATLSGRRDGERLRDDHRHAHYLALDEDGDRLVDTLLVWAPGGLTQDEVAALARVTYVKPPQHLRALADRYPLGLEAVGAVPTLAPALAGPATTWSTVTPFAPSHLRRRREDVPAFVDRQVRRELGHRAEPDHDPCAERHEDDAAYPDPSSVRVLRVDEAQRTHLTVAAPLAYRRRRERHGAADVVAHHVRVAFPRPVRGPLALGALSHFGLGLFAPVPDGPGPR